VRACLCMCARVCVASSAQLQRKLFEIVVFSISLSVDERKRETALASLSTTVPHSTDARSPRSQFDRLSTLACQVLTIWCVRRKS
jgi:hypothetical protein